VNPVITPGFVRDLNRHLETVAGEERRAYVIATPLYIATLTGTAGFVITSAWL